VIDDLFEIYHPVAVDADDADGGGVFFVRIGVGIRGDGVVNGVDVEGKDICVLKFLLCFWAEPVIVFFPLFEHHPVCGVGVEVEGSFFVIAVEGGADEFSAGVLGVLGFLIGMGVVAGCQQEDGESGEEDFFDHGAKIRKIGPFPRKSKGPMFC
jgi:hypothetical protein